MYFGCDCEDLYSASKEVKLSVKVKRARLKESRSICARFEKEAVFLSGVVITDEI